MKLHPKCHREYLSAVVISTCILCFACTSKNKASGPELHLLTYSSLGSQGGFLNSVKSEFEVRSKCTLQIETTLGATQILSYLEEPKQREQLDVVMGLDRLVFERAKSAFFLADPPSLRPQEQILPLLKDQVPSGFIPTDYGALSFIYRKSELKGKVLPTHLMGILKPEFKQKWIVQDPRASSPGMIFFLFADSLLLHVWDLKNQWVTLAPSWDSSYKMFMAKDAPMVWSYLTSLAYHASKGEGDQYGALEFVEGQPVQIEGMAVLNHVGNPYLTNPCIEKWVKFVLDPVVQTTLAEKQYMMPIHPGAALPKYFDTIPVLKKTATIDYSLDKVDHLINRFGREVQGAAL